MHGNFKQVLRGGRLVATELSHGLAPCNRYHTLVQTPYKLYRYYFVFRFLWNAQFYMTLKRVVFPRITEINSQNRLIWLTLNRFMIEQMLVISSKVKWFRNKSFYLTYCFTLTLFANLTCCINKLTYYFVGVVNMEYTILCRYNGSKNNESLSIAKHTHIRQ